MGKPSLKSRVDGKSVTVTSNFTPFPLLQAQFAPNTLPPLTQFSLTTAF